jgi:Putative Ig domain
MGTSRKTPCQFVVLMLTLALAACGGGGGGGSTSGTGGTGGSGGTGSTTFSYPTTTPLIEYVPIAPISPLNATGLTNFTLEFPMQPLPTGLSLNPTTGVISGTPTSNGYGGTYTIEASATGGKGASATVTLNVSPVAANAISYGASAITYTANVPGRTLTPQTAGEAITGWAISPQLPAGLTFNASSGVISGTPTAASAATTYTVSAKNAAGPLSVSFTIQVQPNVLVNLGHGGAIIGLNFNGSQILSLDANEHWVLWNYSTGTMIASGDSACQNSCTIKTGLPVALAGPTAVILTSTGLQILNAATGTTQGTINTSANWWQLAEDGSYLTIGTADGLTVYSPSGQVLVSIAGNYAGAITFDSPGAVRIANGAGGPNVIETLTVPAGADTISPTFNGTFSAWFLDGSAFFSIVGGTTLVYSNAAASVTGFASPVNATVAGEGPWFWESNGQNLTIYALTAPTTAAATFTFPGSSGGVGSQGSTLEEFSPTTGTVSVIDLSGATPVKVDYTTPITTANGQSYINAFAASSASQFVLGSSYGVLLDGASLSGTARYFGYGQALSVAGNGSQIALATASGRILYFNAGTLAQEGTITFTSGELAISPDGSTLAAAPVGTPINAPSLGAQELNIYPLPAGGAPLYSWPYPTSGSTTVSGISLAGTGSSLVLGQVVFDSSTYRYTDMISAPTGGAESFSATQASPSLLLLSTDATVFATSNSQNGNSAETSLGINLYQNDQLVTAVNGSPAGWIDDSHLLVNNFVNDSFIYSNFDYAGCSVYSVTGASSGTCAIPEVLAFQNVSSGTIYANNLNEILTVDTGAVAWASGNALSPSPLGQAFDSQPVSAPYLSALAGNYVVFVSSAYVVAQTY